MIDDQAMRTKAIAQKHESFFIVRVIWIVDQAGILIQEHSLGFLERDAVLCKVQSGLAAIPGKLYIAHSIMLAIWRCYLASICGYSRSASRGGRKRARSRRANSPKKHPTAAIARYMAPTI